MHGVPHEVANAAAEMQEESEGATEQHNLTGPRCDDALNDGVSPWPRRRGSQPDNQPHGEGTQDDAGDPIGDRQDRSELRSIMLDVGRERSGMLWRDVGQDETSPVAVVSFDAQSTSSLSQQSPFRD